MKDEEIKRFLKVAEYSSVEFKRARGGVCCGQISCGGVV